MKAIIIIIIIACAVGLYFYLQKGDETETGGKGPTVDLDNLTVTPGVGIGPVKFGMSKDEVIKLLGKPDKDQGSTLDYVSKGFSIVFFGSSGGVYYIGCKAKQPGQGGGFKGATDKGIQMGATERQIYAAYGKPGKRLVGRDAGGPPLISVAYINPFIFFELKNGKLYSMNVQKKP